MRRSLQGLLVSLFCLLTALETLSAYNPPWGAEDFLSLAQPVFSGTSPAGGGIFNPGTWTNEQNPALAARNERVAAELGYSALLGKKNNSDFALGTALRAGLLLPTRYGVFSGVVTGLIAAPEASSLGNNFMLKASWARDITENFYLGATVYTGIQINKANGGDFALAADLGALILLGSNEVLRDMRLGLALSNLGKTFVSSSGISGPGLGFFPAYVTPRIGFAATLAEDDVLKTGFSAGLSVPSFQDLGLSLSLDMLVLQTVNVNLGWDYRLRESLEWKKVRSPYLSVQVSFRWDSSGVGLLAEQGWTSTDINIGTSYNNIGRDLHSLSAGVSGNFGMQDNEAPVIELWGGPNA